MVLLEQLDASMKYERRSIIDKNELLVDVRMPKMGIDDDEQEEEYLKPFKFDENVGKDVLEKLDDGDDDDDDENTEDYAASADALHGIDDDDEEVCGPFLDIRYWEKYKKTNRSKNHNRFFMY